MTVLEWLVAMDACGVTTMHRDGNDIACGIDMKRHNARKYRRLCKIAVREGIEQQVLPMLSPLPREVLV